MTTCYLRRRRGFSAAVLAYALLAYDKLAGVSVGYGPTAGGRVVQIIGAGFTGATGVTFGGTAGTSFSVVSDTLIEVTTPAKTAGAVDVVVQHPSGDSTIAGGYTYHAGPSISGATITPSSGPMSGGDYVAISGATGLKPGATLTVGGVAHPLLVVDDTSAVWVSRPVTLANTGAKNLVITNPDGQTSTKTSGYTYKAQSALAFSSMTALLAVKANYPTGTSFRAVDSSSNHFAHLILEADGSLVMSGYVDWTKAHAFLDHASYQFADITGTSNLTVDSDGVTFDVATGGAIYLKGFAAHVEQRSIVCLCDLLVGNATAATNDEFYAGWITDPTVAYTLNAGGPYFNGTNWRQARHSGSNVAAPTVTQASNNMVVTPSAVSFETWILCSIHRQCEDGTESMILGGNKQLSGYQPANDGSTTLNTSVAMAATAGQKIWYLCFGMRSASTGTARMRLKSSVISMGVML